ncbi:MULTISPECIES: hypothetical protein [unclassified Thalassolituus]|jgi:hypothetical protein|uniref:hypothetical protein n=1 Tax=Oceanospirillaceae TaxID=135620 RepID=UPI0016487510|nr:MULTISPECIES: hypothetical protein [unclassified Thalassolituus]MBU2038382.1 hypothetical protein [Gammaproteobacteria bacterium]MCA6058953.1 hypothetical protein [Thalassolituus sp. ST750PaO-4]
MVKQLIVFLIIIALTVAVMVYYHVNTESPFDGEAFFGPKERPAEPSPAPQNKRP